MIKELVLFKDKVLVTDLEFGIVKTEGGVIIPDDDGKSSGIKPRWAKVYKVGPETEGVEEGDYVLLKHGRWTRNYEVELETIGKIKISMVDYPDAVLAVSKEKPSVLAQLAKSL